MKKLFTLILLINISLLSAQTTVDFEEFNIGLDSFLNGSDGSGGFTTGNIFLNNNFNAAYASWTGWSISSTTDVTTPGFMNIFSSFAGEGAEGSETYGTSFSFTPSIIELNNEAAGEEVRGVYINNATYAALSMTNGDAYAKKFGGASGDDPDYFLLTIQKYLGGNLSDEKVEFYLADYRFEDNSQDYIVSDWTWVDLTSLGQADSLSFALSSTDNGGFGMNTPAVFCIDNLITGDGVSSTSDLLEVTINVFPNPTTEFLNVSFDNKTSAEYLIFDMQGRLVDRERLEFAEQHLLNVVGLNTGQYILYLKNEEGIARTQFSKL